MKIVLVGAGPFKSPSSLRALREALRDREALTLAVDGGYEVFRRLKREPDLYVGDLDSVKKIPQELPAVFLPHSKDYSDLRAALEIAMELGATHLECFGVTGGRPDHHWASLAELEDFAGDFQSIVARGDDGSCYWVGPQSSLSLTVKKGAVISLFSLDSARGITTQGLAYNLKNEALRSASHGLSNFARGAKVVIRVRQGRLLVVVPERSGIG